MRIREIAAACAVLHLIGIGVAHAEPEKVGPLNLTAQVYKVDVPFTVDGTLDANSSGGDFNAEATFTLSSPTSQLRDNIMAISNNVLPYSYAKAACPIRFNKISNLEISYQENEADINATVNLTVSGCFILNGTSDVPIGIAIAPAVKPTQLGWTVLRVLNLKLNGMWKLFQRYGGGPQKVFQKILDDNAVISLPTEPGVNASLQGSKFTGDAATLSLFVKGDAHSSGPSLTTLLAQTVTDLLNPKLEYPVPKTK
jgi:hypothetical protein